MKEAELSFDGGATWTPLHACSQRDLNCVLETVGTALEGTIDDARESVRIELLIRAKGLR